MTTQINENEITGSEAHGEVSHEQTIYAEPVFHIGNFPVTNSLVNSWMTVLVIFIFALALRLKLKKIPSGIQHVFEIIVEGGLDLCDQVTNDRKISEKIFPFVLSLFVFILLNNWLGILPITGSIGFIVSDGGHQVFHPLFRAGTADINTTLALSVVFVIAANIFGAFAIGIWKTFNKYVNLKVLGTMFTKVRKDPSILIVAPISFFVGLLELIGEFAKILSLSFRLFGNVFAGEVLLASMGAIFLYLLPTPFIFLEFFVGLIQALIFALLATVYFTIAAQDHSEEEIEEYEEELEREKLANV